MSQGDLNQLEVQEKIKRWQRFEGDTGSAEVVVGILTARIAQHAPATSAAKALVPRGKSLAPTKARLEM